MACSGPASLRSSAFTALGRQQDARFSLPIHGGPLGGSTALMSGVRLPLLAPMAGLNGTEPRVPSAGCKGRRMAPHWRRRSRRALPAASLHHPSVVPYRGHRVELCLFCVGDAGRACRSGNRQHLSLDRRHSWASAWTEYVVRRIEECLVFAGRLGGCLGVPAIGSSALWHVSRGRRLDAGVREGAKRLLLARAPPRGVSLTPASPGCGWCITGGMTGVAALGDSKGIGPKASLRRDIRGRGHARCPIPKALGPQSVQAAHRVGRLRQPATSRA